MNSSQAATLPVVVIGGGISGLAAADRLLDVDATRPVRLLEAGSRLGGLLQTSLESGFLWEAAADGFHPGSSEISELCHRLELDDQIVYATPSKEPLQVVHKGRLVPSPLTLMSGASPSKLLMLKTGLLSLGAKCRVFGERFVKPSHTDDESCASFFIRRFGAQFYSRLVEPVLGGVYSADPATLSMRALLPSIREMERRYGSLTAALKRQKRAAHDQSSSAAARGAWTLRGGMSQLVNALAAKLPPGAIKLGTPVHGLQTSGDGIWQVAYGHGQTLPAAGVVIATPAHQAAHLINGICPQATRLLQHISYSSVAVVALGYQAGQVRRPLRSHGFFVPAAERLALRSASVTSFKFAGRAPAGTVLVRASLGGENHSTVIDQSDAELVREAHRALSPLLKIEGSPVFGRVKRHMFAIPQYRVGHHELIAVIRERLHDFPGLALTGNAYNGIGVPACVASGQQAAEQVSQLVRTIGTRCVPSPLSAVRLTTPEEHAHA